MSRSESAFVLDLTATNGRPLAPLSPDGGPPELHEWTSWLRIRSDISGFVPPTYNPDDDELTGFVPPAFEEDGLALLAIARDMQDLPGEAIGLFHARLDAQDLEDLRAAVEATPWLDLPRPVGGDYHAPTLTLTYQRGTKRICRSFSALSNNFLEAIAPLWRLIDRATVRAGKSAASSWWLELGLAPDPDLPLVVAIQLRLRSRGVGHVVVNDPRLPVEPGEIPRLQLFIGEQDPDCPDAAPDNVVEIPVPTLAEGAPGTLLVRPTDRVELSLPWRVARPGRYHVRAVWRDYGGPVEPAPGQTPFMPLGRTGPSQLGSGPYPIHGAVFAEQLVDVPAPNSDSAPNPK